MQKLLDLRLGPGAAILPQDIKRINLDFAFKINNGHFGARKFWRKYLPRLKYHNPAVSMTVNRTKDQAGPATLTVFFARPPPAASGVSSPAPSSSTTTALPSDHTPFDRMESIDMKNIQDHIILSRFLALTKAAQVTATPEEEAEVQKLKEENDLCRRDALVGAKHREKLMQDKALLDQARGGILEG